MGQEPEQVTLSLGGRRAQPVAPSRGRLATPARPAPEAVVTMAWRLLAPIRQTKRRELLFAIQERALRCGWQPAGNDCSSPCPLAVLTADLLQRINGVGERCSPPCLRNRAWGASQPGHHHPPCGGQPRARLSSPVEHQAAPEVPGGALGAASPWLVPKDRAVY